MTSRTHFCSQGDKRKHGNGTANLRIDLLAADEGPLKVFGSTLHLEHRWGPRAMGPLQHFAASLKQFAIRVGLQRVTH